MDALVFRNLQHDLKKLLQENIFTFSLDEDDTVDPINVSFLAPNKDFVASVENIPVVNCYMIGIEEDKKRRQSDPLRSQLSSDNKTFTRFYEPRFVDISYMITVWTGDTKNEAEIEHLILGALINGLGRYDFFPINEISGAKLEESIYGIRMMLFGSEYADKISGQVWQAMGATPKPCLMLSFSIPVDVRAPTTPTIIEEIQNSYSNTNPSAENDTE